MPQVHEPAADLRVAVEIETRVGKCAAHDGDGDVVEGGEAIYGVEVVLQFSHWPVSFVYRSLRVSGG